MQKWDLYRGLLVNHRNSEDGKTYLARVEKVNPKWTVIQYEDGRRWNASPAGLTEAPAGSVFNIDEAEGLELGNPVRVIEGKFASDDIWSVLDIKGGTYKLAKVRGSGNRYLRGVPASHLALVPEGEAVL